MNAEAEKVHLVEGERPLGRAAEVSEPEGTLQTPGVVNLHLRGIRAVQRHRQDGSVPHERT